MDKTTIKDARLKAHLSIKDVANVLKVSRFTVKLYERGYKYMDAYELVIFCKLVNVKVNNIVY